MKLTVVGCSGTMPGAEGPASCYLLEADGFRLLVDCGNGASGALQLYVGLLDLDAVLITHVHADHCLDLVVYSFARRYGTGNPKPIPVYGPAGLQERLLQAFDVAPADRLGGVYDFRTLRQGRRTIGPFAIDVAPMNHPVETWGLRIMADGASIAYSADTGECPALLDLARNADLLLCEAGFKHGAPGNVEGLHLTGRQAGEHAAKAGAKRLLLTHIPPWIDRDGAVREASATFRGPVELARAGATYDLWVGSSDIP
jgi:ribonuclease BN (tRNA processing enzyme)